MFGTTDVRVYVCPPGRVKAGSELAKSCLSNRSAASQAILGKDAGQSRDSGPVLDDDWLSKRALLGPAFLHPFFITY